jgi:hypothetical protein
MEPTLVSRVKHRIGDGCDGAQRGAGEALRKSARPCDIGFDRSIARHDSGCDDPIACRQMRVEPASDAKTDDRRCAGEHGFFDGMRLKPNVPAAGEHMHTRCRDDPRFSFQPRDDNQTRPLIRCPPMTGATPCSRSQRDDGRRSAHYKSRAEKCQSDRALRRSRQVATQRQIPIVRGASFGAESRRRSAQKKC